MNRRALLKTAPAAALAPIAVARGRRRPDAELMAAARRYSEALDHWLALEPQAVLDSPEFLDADAALKATHDRLWGLMNDRGVSALVVGGRLVVDYCRHVGFDAPTETPLLNAVAFDLADADASLGGAR